MKTITENIAAVKELLAEVKNHCMCFRFIEDPQHYLVQFPAGYQVDGVRVTKVNGKKWALEKALEKMELYWKAA